MKKIAFWDNNLNFRGTSESIYDYAHFNEEILGNQSVIFSLKSGDLQNLNKFEKRFQTILVDDFSECDKFIYKNKFDYIYIIKYGCIDNLVSLNTPSLIHSVFNVNQPHGYKYFYVSDYLAKLNNYSIDSHSLPHIVKKINIEVEDYREKLKIPRDALVFGCLGGKDEFNINFAKTAVNKILSKNNNIYFLFMTITKFIDHPRAIFLPSTKNENYEKLSFVRACDAMLHAREGGETFGCACAEFGIENKPIITYSQSGVGFMAHVDILKEKAILYSNEEELYDILSNFNKYNIHKDYASCYKNYSPELIMNKFKNLL